MKLEGGLQFTEKVKEPLLEEMEAQRKAAGIEFTEARIERLEASGEARSFSIMATRKRRRRARAA